MSTLMAIDVAVLLPPPLADRAVSLSAALPPEESKGLQLGPDALPHVTLTQLFIRREELESVLERADEVIRGEPPVVLHVTGASVHGQTVSMAVERTAQLDRLHERLMDALRGFERSGGGPDAFAGDGGRLADVIGVTGYRLQSAFGAWSPHVTLGHAAVPPPVEAMEVSARAIAVCQLGPFCTCRGILRQWALA